MRVRVRINNRFCFSPEAEAFKAEFQNSADPLMKKIVSALIKAENNRIFDAIEVSEDEYFDLFWNFTHVDATSIHHAIIKKL